jgi:hypothetical protein
MIFPKSRPNPTPEAPLIPHGTRAERRDTVFRGLLTVKKALGFDHTRIPIVKRETEIEWFQIQFLAELSAYETLELFKPEIEKLASRFAPNNVADPEISNPPKADFPNGTALYNEGAPSDPIQQKENTQRFQYNASLILSISSLLCLALTVTSIFLIIALRHENTATARAIQEIRLKLDNPSAYELHLKNGTAPITPVRQSP